MGQVSDERQGRDAGSIGMMRVLFIDGPKAAEQATMSRPMPYVSVPVPLPIRLTPLADGEEWKYEKVQVVEYRIQRWRTTGGELVHLGVSDSNAATPAFLFRVSAIADELPEDLHNRFWIGLAIDEASLTFLKRLAKVAARHRMRIRA